MYEYVQTSYEDLYLVIKKKSNTQYRDSNKELKESSHYMTVEDMTGPTTLDMC